MASIAPGSQLAAAGADEAATGTEAVVNGLVREYDAKRRLGPQIEARSGSSVQKVEYRSTG